MNNNSGKSMGVSPITGTIYCGMLKDDEWVGEKEDVNTFIRFETIQEVLKVFHES